MDDLIWKVGFVTSIIKKSVDFAGTIVVSEVSAKYEN